VSIDEANGYLPEVCACCDEPATSTRTKQMSWCPPWVGVLIIAGLLPYLIVMLILTKRATVQVPFCERHKGHWLYRNLLIGGTFVLFALLAVAGFAAAMVFGGPRQDDLFGFVCLGTFGLGLVWLIITIVAQNTAIRPKEITDSEILLAGVSGAFVDAVQEADSSRRLPRRKRSSKWDDDDYEEEEMPRKKKRPPSDAIEEE
jgi:hypothetical protein